eukprot:gene12034-25905_t
MVAAISTISSCVAKLGCAIRMLLSKSWESNAGQVRSRKELGGVAVEAVAPQARGRVSPQLAHGMAGTPLPDDAAISEMGYAELAVLAARCGVDVAPLQGAASVRRALRARRALNARRINAGLRGTELPPVSDMLDRTRLQQQQQRQEEGGTDHRDITVTPSLRETLQRLYLVAFAPALAAGGI